MYRRRWENLFWLVNRLSGGLKVPLRTFLLEGEEVGGSRFRHAPILDMLFNI